jgi:hypothetical protein
MTIRRGDPVREAFSGCSSGNGPGTYYETKGHALRAFDAALNDFGYHLDHADNAAWSGDEGRHEVDVYTGQGEAAGFAVIYYHRMVTGRWEFVGYIA